MLVSDFCEKYDLNVSNLYVAKSEGKIPDTVFYRPLNAKRNHIDERYFVRRKEFRKRVKLFNEDVYYYLTEHFSVLEITEIIQKLYGVHHNATRVFLYHRLFMTDSGSMLATTLTKPEWALFKYGRLLEQELSVKYGYKVKISEILDKRAGL